LTIFGQNKVPAKDIFPRYVAQLDRVFATFYEQQWPCEYRHPSTGARCVNVSIGHAKGHQSKDGKLLAVGQYLTKDPPNDEARKKFKNHTYYCLDELILEHTRTVDTDGLSDQRAAAKVHKDKVLVSFFRRNESETKPKEAISSFLSHHACFCRLLDAAEHPLPCGHVLCTQCILTYSESNVDSSHAWLKECPLEGAARRWEIPYRFRLKPEFAGVRVMSLDG